MELFFKRLTEESLFSMLDMFSLKDLKRPIVEKPKIFSKDHQGFRAKRLPQKIVYDIYYKYILENKELIEYLSNLAYEYFENLDIIEILKRNIPSIEKASEIFIKFANNGVMHKVLPVLIVSGATITEDEMEKIILQEERCLSLFHILNNKCEEKVQSELTSLDNKYEEEKKLLSEKYKSLKNNFLELKESINLQLELQKTEYTKKIEAIDLEKGSLKKQLDSCVEKSVMLQNKLDTILKQNNELRQERDSLRHVIKEYKDTIANKERELTELTHSTISKEDINSIVYEMMNQLKSISIINKEFIAKAIEKLNRDQIDNAWLILSEEENGKIVDIIAKMINNYIESDDIILLDQIEDNVCIKYVIVKKLKELFFAFLGTKEKNVNQLNKLIKE